MESIVDHPSAKVANEKKETSTPLGEMITKSQTLEEIQRPEENLETKLAGSTQ